MIAFLDASALIYLIEGAEPFVSMAKAQLAALETLNASLRAAVSRISWLECRVKPLREKQRGVLASFDAFFARPDLVWVELTEDVVELATVVRARHGLRTPDAIQAASCLQLGHKHRFITGDRTFQQVASLNVTMLTELT